MEGNLKKISFTSNWNNKLLCDIFPTMRLANPDKYKIGELYNLYLNKDFLGRVELVAINKLSYLKISNEIAYVDAGKPAGYLKTLLSNFYPNANWSTQKLYWLWFKHLDHEKSKDKLIHQRAKQLRMFDVRPTVGVAGLPDNHKKV